MKISTLLNREPFPELFEKTMILFLLEDLIFHIDEKNNDVFYKAPLTLSNLCSEI
tara:strand:- start:246 stop:410 length:165 start_codon:yes stop_codon:yes gene_type:complete